MDKEKRTMVEDKEEDEAKLSPDVSLIYLKINMSLLNLLFNYTF